MAGFTEVAQLAEQLSTQPGRLKKRAAIAESVARVAAESIADAGRLCLYLAGQPFAEADPRKLNTGGALLSRAVKTLTAASDAALTATYRRHGDLGAAAADLWPPTAGPSPSLTEVETAFAAMASARTTAVRAELLETLLRRSNALEVKYLLKLMLNDMRIGVKQSLIEDAIAVAATADVVAVRHAVMLEADLARVVRMAFAGTLAEARMRLFHPLGFMLASPVETPEEAVQRFTEPAPKSKPTPKSRTSNSSTSPDLEPPATPPSPPTLEPPVTLQPSTTLEGARLQPCHSNPATTPALAAEVGSDPLQANPTPLVHAFLEDKYDGMRVQIHCGDPTQPGRVALYSRTREDITEGFPEIVEAFRHIPEPLMLDGELLGWDFAANKALPFSILGQRIGRKKVDNDLRRKVPVIFMAFDLLFEAGELLLPLPLRARRQRLESLAARLQPITVSPIELDARSEAAQRGLFAATPTGPSVERLMLSPARLVESAEEIDRAYADARARANEGVMLKAAGSAYQPGRRGLAWVKLKRELATLDVVITGAEFGHGRRAGFLSDYTFAVRGPTSPETPDGELLNVGKAYSGVTDVEILELTSWLQAHTLEDLGHFRTVEPLRVLEVAFNNVMRSDRHASGFALRFPRILRIRDDKPVDEIDTLERVEEIYSSQPDKGKD